MQPQRKCTINGKLIEQYYWAGELVVCVDHYAVETTYDQAVEAIRREAEQEGKAK